MGTDVAGMSPRAVAPRPGHAGRPAVCITTSWDDGHPLDLRIAELLAKYGLQGTFYIPCTGETATMSPSQVRHLGSAFEVGAHTLHHINLWEADDDAARREIFGSKTWLEDLLGTPCRMFCPPGGRFRRHQLGFAREAGYLGVRTVELLSTRFPRLVDGVMLMPTTVQAEPHTALVYLKNAGKRLAYRNLWAYLRAGPAADWPRLVDVLARRALEHGGVFHLWGHSWEIEQHDQWGPLEDVLALLGQYAGRVPALTNAEVCVSRVDTGADGEPEPSGGTATRSGIRLRSGRV